MKLLQRIDLLFQRSKIRWSLFFVTLFLVVVFLGKSLNPAVPFMFDFHDETQPGRLAEFAFNLSHLKLPPRMAPHFSYNMGYPVFNYYAPSAYWLGALFDLVGFGPIGGLKIAFLLALVVAFVAMFLFLREFFSFYAAVAGAVFYVTATYFPVNIFIRGNLSETWFMALFPLALFFLMRNARTPSPKIFFLTTAVFFFLFTVHNIFSLISVPVIFLFVLLMEKKKANIIAIVFALLLGSYFLLPAVTESGLTYASRVAKETHYDDHFLCLSQLWTSPWGYGGSTSGCLADGMSFKLGKPQVIFGALGGLAFLYSVLLLLRKKKKAFSTEHKILTLIFVTTVFSLFLTLYESALVWRIFAFVLSLFQFPWRFLVFGTFGVAVFSGYFLNRLKLPLSSFFLIVVSFGMLFINSKYFAKVFIESARYTELYLSKDYIYSTVAYKIPEYLPRTADYRYWQQIKSNPHKVITVNTEHPLLVETKDKKSVMVLKNEAYEKEILTHSKTSFVINIHYFPYWQMKIDDKPFKPTLFDRLGRPIISVDGKTRIQLRFRQTPIEKMGNIITLVTAALLFVLLIKTPWIKTAKRLS